MQSITNNVARGAIAAGLGIALALGTVTCPTSAALAETPAASAPQGTITIVQQNNKNAIYDAYQLFVADVDGSDQASQVAWASSDMEKAVLAFLDDNSYGAWLKENHSGDGQREKAQNALEYIAHMIETSKKDTQANTKPDTPAAGSFAHLLAQRLAANNALRTRQAKAGEAFTDREGYWLFVTSASSLGDGSDAGTAPLWVALGGSATTIDEKSSVPSVEKQVREDAGSAWGKTADANIGQTVTYRLVGRLPSNFGTFKSYRYRFDDTLSKGLDLVIPKGKGVAQAVRVLVGDKEVAAGANGVAVSWNNQVLSVEFADLKAAAWKDYALSKDTVITVEYQARLNANAVIGAKGNDNDVVLTYTNDPVSEGTGKTAPTPPARLFTYALRLLKVDGQTTEPVAGAGFTLQVATKNTDKESAGKYVQKNGTLGSEPYEFVTEADGSVKVKGLDEGSYLIRETTAPKSFAPLDDGMNLTIGADRSDPNLSITKMTATLADTVPQGSAATVQTKVSAVDESSGVVTLTVANDRRVPLPLTGMEGIGGGVAGVAIASTAGVALWWRRREDR